MIAMGFPRVIEHPLRLVWATGLLAALCSVSVPMAFAITPHGKIQGRIVGTDTGEPIGFADISLIPADTSLRPVGGLTNGDGTFLLEAPPGRYTLQIRALSYSLKRVEGVTLLAGQLLPFSTALQPQAIQQKEIVVEAKARQNTERSLLTARKKAAAVGDAVSAEQVRKSPDKDAAEVLRRVTGLSVSEGKYVFVRGLGERYSSTEIDGVRVASPEQNKRVVPLDLVPANLLENIVVQKSYTADRPAEFGGGDVQVHTKDFPGARTWSLSVSQGYAEGVTMKQRSTYESSRADIFGFGAGDRAIPDAVLNASGNRALVFSFNPSTGFTKAQLAQFAKSFSDTWSPYSVRTMPNSSYSATYGDELRLFGHPLGLIESWSLSRGFDHRDESQRLYRSSSADTVYDYEVSRFTESVQLGGISGLSYRLSPAHAIHLRGLFTNSADDEVRTYHGYDHNQTEATTGQWAEHIGTRLMYVQRSILSGTMQGEHGFPHLLGTHLDWQLTRSRATRQQPDRREYTYDHRYYYVGNPPRLVNDWALSSLGGREFGDLRDNATGATLKGAIPYRLGALGAGRLLMGYDHQTKRRDNFYRRFVIHQNPNSDPTAPPDTIFAPPTFDGSPGTGWIEEKTLRDRFFTDNYRATQRQSAGFASLDVPLGRHARGSLGLRQEWSYQDVQSFDPFAPSIVLQEGKLDDKDWLPSVNLTLSATEAVNLRLAASRTVSRPDLNELSPSPALEYTGGALVLGNPNLKRARIDNYDVRVEAFPSPSEVFAAGWFYKRLYDPIEQSISGGGSLLVKPFNSGEGRNAGAEFELRSDLGRFHRRLRRLSLNTNASFISSNVQNHPLQGQASYIVNGALNYLSMSGGLETTLLLSSTGKRLEAVGVGGLPNIFEQPATMLDASLSFGTRHFRVKLNAKNLLDQRILVLQGGKEISGYRPGRGYSVSYSYGL